MLELLTPPFAQVQSSEILTSNFLSRWHKDEFDMRESLILPLAKVRPGEILDLIIRCLAGT
jgi:hypothetical protein